MYSCMTEEDQDCGFFLEFRYDHNMEYKDMFYPHIATVDVYVFDEGGKFLFTRHAAQTELVGNNRMSLGTDLPHGTYRILSLGGLTADFRVTGSDGQEPVVGVTTLEEMRLSLLRQSETVSRRFEPVWWGSPAEVVYTGDPSVIPVYFVKNTNDFAITLTRTDGSGNKKSRAALPYTVEIQSPEGAVYGWDNSPADNRQVTYQPYTVTPGVNPEDALTGKINTCRLFDGDEYPYRIIVRDAGTGDAAWSYDLVNLLSFHKPSAKPDGNPLPLQEYLDRKSIWDLVVLYREGGEGESEGFIAVAVIINDWIMWLHEIEE